jgi:hypothetical protein
VAQLLVSITLNYGSEFSYEYEFRVVLFYIFLILPQNPPPTFWADFA